jgi:putative hemolysin
MDISSLLGVLAVFALIAANGFFVAAEFALVKIRATRIDQLVDEGNKTALIVQKQIHHLDTYIAATQLGITLASLALGWVGEPSLAHLIEPLFDWIGGETALGLTHTLAVVISFALITTLHIVLGELVPKSIALQNSEGTTLFVARPLYVFSRVLRPFIMLMNGVGGLVVRMLGLKMDGEHVSVHSVEELEMLVMQSRQAGVLNDQEEELLRHVFDFGDKTVHDVMIPRIEIVGVPLTITLEELQHMMVKERYTRLPVYRDTLDSIVGMVHIKDVFSYLSTRNIDGKASVLFDIQRLIRPILDVPETITLDTLMARMRAARTHMAIVIDEYGSTAGMVTLEDIFEELVGEVQDEFDTSEEGVRNEVEPHPDGTTSVDGLMSLASFSERFGTEWEETHVHTVGGYVFERLDRLPRVGDTVQVDDYTLTVEEMDQRRIARILVKPQTSEDADEETQKHIAEANTAKSQNGQH